MITDKQEALEGIRANNISLGDCSYELRDDKEVVLTAVKQDGEALKYASDELRNNINVVIAAVEEDGLAFKYASNKLRHNKDVLMDALIEDYHSLAGAPDEFRNDKDIVTAAVLENSYALQFASDELRNDKDVVLMAVEKNGLALEYASYSLRGDKDIVMAAVKNNSLALVYASKASYTDKDIIMATVKKSGLMLEYASEELRNDIEVVMPAVEEDGRALEYASDKLRNDKEVVMAAIDEDAEAIKYASDTLRNDKDVIMTAIEQYGMKLSYASKELQNNKEVVLEAVKQDGRAIQFASDELRGDKEIVMEAVKEDSRAFTYASEKIRNNKDFVMEAVREDSRVLEFAPDKFRYDKDVVLAAVKHDAWALIYTPELLRNDKDVIQAAKEQKREALNYFKRVQNEIDLRIDRAGDGKRAGQDVSIEDENSARQDNTTINNDEHDKMLNDDMHVYLAPKYELGKAFAETTHIDAAIEAEYGEYMIEGEITLAHHGPRKDNPAPCNTIVDTEGKEFRNILVSHLDLDTVGGIMAIAGKKPEDKEFWAGVEYIDVNGPHHIHELSQDVQDKINAVFAAEYDCNKDKLRPPFDKVYEVTNDVNEYANNITKALNPELNKEMIERGREWANDTMQEVESKLLYETDNYRVFNTNRVFCSAAYYSPEEEKIKPATIVFNSRFNAVTLAFEDGGKKYNAAKIMQEIFGPGAGGHAGIAGTPRGEVMTPDDLKKVEDKLDELFRKDKELTVNEINERQVVSIEDDDLPQQIVSIEDDDKKSKKNTITPKNDNSER